MFGFDFLNSLWRFGYIFVGQFFSLKAASYTARYLTDKAKGDDYGYVPSFNRASIGFGKKYFLDNIDSVISQGYCFFDKQKYRIPRYYIELTKKFRPDLYKKFYARAKNFVNKTLQFIFDYKNKKSPLNPVVLRSRSEILYKQSLVFCRSSILLC